MPSPARSFGDYQAIPPQSGSEPVVDTMALMSVCKILAVPRNPLAVLATSYGLSRGRFGERGSQATREDQAAASSLSDNATGKRAIFMISTLGCLIARTPCLALVIAYQRITAYGINRSVSMLFLVPTDGLGRFLGPEIGTIRLFALQRAESDLAVWYLATIAGRHFRSTEVNGYFARRGSDTDPKGRVRAKVYCVSFAVIWAKSSSFSSSRPTGSVVWLILTMTILFVGSTRMNWWCRPSAMKTSLAASVHHWY